MKWVIICCLFLLPGVVKAQDNYEVFRKKMSEIEKREKELRNVIWGKNDYSKHYKDSVWKILDVLVQDKKNFALQSVRENPEDSRFLQVLDIYVRNFLTLDEFETELKRFSEKVQETEDCKEKFEFIGYAREMQPGKPCVDFQVKGHEGESIVLSEVLKKNKVVLIDFWASWCGACRASIPYLKEVYKKYASKGFEILCVSLDGEKEKWDKAYQKEAFPWIDGSNLLGWKDPLVLKYAIRGIPHQVLVAQDGTIIQIGFYRRGALEEELDKYFAQDHSVRFENGTFQEALDKAKQSGKLLFVDCYTSWCGPCKMLAKEVFTNREVAAYFNEHFISFKIDCEKGEGPELQKRFGVSGYPTLLFINGDGEVVNKIVGASKQPVFLENVKKGLDPNTSLYGKEQKYKSGCRDRAFVLDLIESYKDIHEAQKAKQVSLEFLEEQTEETLLTPEGWSVISYYYVSTYGSKWWNFILEHSEEYAALVGKEEVARKIGETMHPYLFAYIYGRRKAESKSEFKTYKKIIDEYQPKQKEVLYAFIELGKSASFGSHDAYFKTVLKVIPAMDRSEHYRFFVNALDFLLNGLKDKQKKQLVELLKYSQEQQTDYFKPLYGKFFEKIEV